MHIRGTPATDWTLGQGTAHGTSPEPDSSKTPKIHLVRMTDAWCQKTTPPRVSKVCPCCSSSLADANTESAALWLLRWHRSGSPLPSPAAHPAAFLPPFTTVFLPVLLSCSHSASCFSSKDSFALQVRAAAGNCFIPY